MKNYPSNGAELKSDNLIIETGNKADSIRVRKGKDETLDIVVNEKRYTVQPNRYTTGDAVQKITIRTHRGNDTIKVDKDVSTEIIIESGDGDDDITARGARSRIFGGGGNDTIRLGSGTYYVEGNDGNDTIRAGRGISYLYGNKGNDRIFGAKAKMVYMNGGPGDDKLYGSKRGHTVMNGGLGDDLLQGKALTTFYAGAGNDKIESNHRFDAIYAKPSDSVQKHPDNIVNPINYLHVGATGIKVEGSPEFKQRVQDDLEMLRSSPTGQKMLQFLDSKAAVNGVPLKIFEVESQESSYYYGHNPNEMKLTEEGRASEHAETSDFGFIQNGKSGTPDRGGEVGYNRSFIDSEPNPVIGPHNFLYHELSHAWNGMNGTKQPDYNSGEQNIELQAVGLPTNKPDFDYDNDPKTPLTNTNPAPFNENALRKEMREPKRERYAHVRDYNGDYDSDE
ncbi:hypothetical protein BLL37_06960 [Pseudomonas azotoformans]|uniref:Hemolysin-like protein n=2 Tax=Pseudomonas azotoformans TaxID=47878 RepID=A0A1V2JN03_PSEAZ|nr:hypothetical protein BFL39_29330 [Pseudomonas azotoformans]ONH42981.1 hypothetical protein BLL37_21085 [Pseudomonas azotoformans]ONH46600.1 hypothetical protein BLL37_06960 [Pseudomonas azotoformans]SDO91152.1 Hemolysin-type calcium-binding repeat-containing protein [Pseudomonas azotoformans]